MKIRTGYSFKTAYGHLPDVMSKLVELGWKSAPISDRLSAFGFTRWTKLARKAGLVPVYGIEIGCAPSLGLKKPPIDYWAFFAKDTLRPLHELFALATNNPGREPTLSYAQAIAAKGVIKIAGERLLLGELPAGFKKDKDFYLGLSPSTPPGLARAALAAGIRPVATSDNYYPRLEDRETYRAALGGGRSGSQTYPMHILSDDEWLGIMAERGFPKAEEALKTRARLLKSAKAKIVPATLIVPEKPKTLRAMCIDGAKRKGVDLKAKVYKERLDRELKIIKAKDFEDYFYILADLIQYAKKHMIVGPARGSSCGSLVCYLLDITAIDPIPFDLIFERFIDLNRTDLPDIDVDFSDTRRHIILDYASEKYGVDHVARLGTVGMFKSRSAINQAGMSLHIPKWKTGKLLDSIIERSSGDARAMNTLEDTFQLTEQGQEVIGEHPELMVATKLEGHPHNASQHAAGVLITREPILESVAVDFRTRSAHCDKKDAEELNLLKIDALGLTQLSVFERCLELIGEPVTSEFFDRIPLDDPEAFKVLNDRKFSGIFQFTGTAMRSLANQIEFNHIMDIVSTTALARPGPLATGGANSWVRRHKGEEAITTIHPMLTELTKDTYSVVVFQETVMRIAREMGKMSWEDTSELRKAMSRSLGDEFFARYWDKFLKGAKENGITEEIARAIWNQINTFGSWAFNKSHAVAYGIVSYWCCWLKAHHPVAYAAAMLDAEADPSKQIQILRELVAEGIGYVPVDLENSKERWSITKKGGSTILVGPLTAIKGIGPAKMREVLDARERGDELRPALYKQLANAKTEIDSLYPIRDAIRKLHPDLAAINILSDPMPLEDVQPGVRGEVLVLAVAKRIAPRDENDSANVTKRGGKRYSGPTKALNLFVADDTDEIFTKVNRFDYERIGREVVSRGKAGKSLYAIKGTVPPDFRMISVKRIKYLGSLDDVG